MISLNEAGLPNLFELVPPYDKLNQAKKENADLATLMAVLQSQSDAIGTNIDLLYQSWFVETCDAWTVPYIAELLDIPITLADAVRISRQRALVANTILYRRFRGTSQALACAVQDASGWPTLAVEGFERQFTSSQTSLNPINQPIFLDLESTTEQSTLLSPTDLDRVSYSVYETPTTPPTSSDSVVLYFWRYQLIENSNVSAYPADDNLYYLDPLGRETPLMLAYRTDRENHTHLPEPLPLPLRMSLLALDELLAEEGTAFSQQISITVDGIALSKKRIFAFDQTIPIDLKSQKSWENQAENGTLALLDPVKGIVRLFTPKGDKAPKPSKVISRRWVAVSSNIGGGAYNRFSRMIFPDATTWSAFISADMETDAPRPSGFDAVYSDLTHALEGFNAHIADKNAQTPEAIFHIADNLCHKVPEQGIDFARKNTVIVLQASQGYMPVLSGSLCANGLYGGELVISGIGLTDTVKLNGNIDLTLIDCTLHSKVGSSIICKPVHESNDRRLQSLICLDHCITGPLELPAQNCVLSVSDCIIDGKGGAALIGANETLLDANGKLVSTNAGAALTASTTTFLGDVDTVQLQSSQNVLVEGALKSYRGSQITPADGIWVSALHSPKAEIVSYKEGTPGYAALSPNNSKELLEGGTEGSEFGVFHSRYTAARYRAAHEAIEDYSPIGIDVELLDAGFEVDRT